MSEENKNAIIQELNVKIGDDINDLSNAEEIEKELTAKQNELQSSLNVANNEVPVRLSDTLQLAEEDTKKIERLMKRNKIYRDRVKLYLDGYRKCNLNLCKDFNAIEQLHEILHYLQVFEKLHHISKLLNQTTDNEQAVQLWTEMREECLKQAHGSQIYYVRHISENWYTILKDRLTELYADILKQLNWPFQTGIEYPPPTKEVMAKFTSLTKCLFRLKQPNDILTCDPGDVFTDDEPSLPVVLLLRPLKRRFAYHFTGNRQTARTDRPEWFLTQTLLWIREHQDFVRMHVQTVADQLQMKNINTVIEFNEGLIQLAAERLYDVLTSYENNEYIVDVDAAFAHAVDETLGFHRELILATGRETNSVLAVLTRASVFIQWLAVEKKYALYKLDEMLENSEWIEPISGGAEAAVGAALWVPRAADLFITLLDTIEDRYKLLPQPGHRLQFLELQLDLVEEWRIRLTQILSASVDNLTEASFLEGSSPHPLTATINAAHHTTTVLLHYTHKLHYLQLHYYRRQFQQYTQQQHRDEEGASVAGSIEVVEEEAQHKEAEIEETMSLKQVELRAKKLAMDEISRQASVVIGEDSTKDSPTSPTANFLINDNQDDGSEEATVFGEAPALLAHLRDAGLSSLAEHILLEFKASLKEYKKQKWHSMPVIEETSLCITAALCRPLSGLCARLNAANSRLAPPLTARLRANLAAEVDTYVYQETSLCITAVLCRPLSGLCARLNAANSRLAPPLTARLRANLAAEVDTYVYQEVVLENWFNTGGILQFTHDVKRNVVPAFAPPNKTASKLNQLPRLLEACKLLNMEYNDARQLRTTLHKNLELGQETLNEKGIRYILAKDTLQILSQRTDLSQTSEPASVLELF